MEQSGWRGQGRDLKLQPATGTGICFPNSQLSPELAAGSRAADVGLEAEFVPADLQGKLGFVVETWSEGLGDAWESHNESKHSRFTSFFLEKSKQMDMGRTQKVSCAGIRGGFGLMSSLSRGRDQPWNSGCSHCSLVLPLVGPGGCVGFLLLPQLNLCPKKGKSWEISSWEFVL